MTTKERARQRFIAEYKENATAANLPQKTIDDHLEIIAEFGVLRPGVPAWEIDAAINTIQNRISRLAKIPNEKQPKTRAEGYEEGLLGF